MVAIVASILLVAVSYLVWVFVFPETTSSLEEKIGLSGTTDKITEMKSKLDDASIWIDAIESVSSWALEIGSWVVDWLDTAKSKIDAVRGTVESARQQYERTKWVVEEFSNSADWLIKISEWITNSVNTWATR